MIFSYAEGYAKIGKRVARIGKVICNMQIPSKHKPFKDRTQEAILYVGAVSSDQNRVKLQQFGKL